MRLALPTELAGEGGRPTVRLHAHVRRCGEAASVISAVPIYHGCQPAQPLLRESGLHSKALPIVDSLQPSSLFLILHLTCCLAAGSLPHIPASLLLSLHLLC